MWACIWVHTEAGRWHWITQSWTYRQLWSNQRGCWEPAEFSRRIASGLNPTYLACALKCIFGPLPEPCAPPPFLMWEVAPRIPFGFRCYNQVPPRWQWLAREKCILSLDTRQEDMSLAMAARRCLGYSIASFSHSPMEKKCCLWF